MILERDDDERENQNAFMDFCFEFVLPTATLADGDVPLLDR